MSNLIKDFYNKFYGEERNICLTYEQNERLLGELLFIKDKYTIFNRIIKNLPITEAINSEQTLEEFRKCYKEINKEILSTKGKLLIKTIFSSMGDMYSINIEYCKKLNILILEEFNNILSLLEQSNNAKNIKENLFNLSFYFAQLSFLTSLMGSYFKLNKLNCSHSIIMISTQMFYEKSMNIFDTYLEWEEKYE